MIDNVKLGIQGWGHPEWIGRLYPANVSSADWLGEYATRFSTVEVDDTFYGIPPEPVVRRWRDSVHPEFSFALKTPQQITHEQRFAARGGLLNRFLERVSLLDEKLGPILLVAPPGFEPDDANEAVLRYFVEQLPSDFRWALEIKHPGWLKDEHQDLLSSKNVAFVCGESRWIPRSSTLKLVEKPTADFAYIRLRNLYDAKHPLGHEAADEDVTTVWEERLERLSELVSSVHGYFHVKAFGDGLRSAEKLQSVIGQHRLEAPASIDQDAT